MKYIATEIKLGKLGYGGTVQVKTKLAPTKNFCHISQIVNFKTGMGWGWWVVVWAGWLINVSVKKAKSFFRLC